MFLKIIVYHLSVSVSFSLTSYSRINLSELLHFFASVFVFISLCAKGECNHSAGFAYAVYSAAAVLTWGGVWQGRGVCLFGCGDYDNSNECVGYES